MSFAARNAVRAVVRSNFRQTLARRHASTAPEVLNIQPSSAGLAKLLESDNALIHHAARS
jgi:hypothetical protein